MLIYTFRTFPHITQLEATFSDVFIFAKLKDDWTAFADLLAQNPEQVIGIALTKGPSREEPIAINKFNHGKVIRDGKDQLGLYTPGIFPLAKKPTHTFCNWTMYHVQHYIHQHALQTSLSFIHVNTDDLALLDELARTRRKQT